MPWLHGCQGMGTIRQHVGLSEHGCNTVHPKRLGMATIPITISLHKSNHDVCENAYCTGPATRMAHGTAHASQMLCATLGMLFPLHISHSVHVMPLHSARVLCMGEAHLLHSVGSPPQRTPWRRPSAQHYYPNPDRKQWVGAPPHQPSTTHQTHTQHQPQQQQQQQQPHSQRPAASQQHQSCLQDSSTQQQQQQQPSTSVDVEHQQQEQQQPQHTSPPAGAGNQREGISPADPTQDHQTTHNHQEPAASSAMYNIQSGTRSARSSMDSHGSHEGGWLRGSISPPDTPPGRQHKRSVQLAR